MYALTLGAKRAATRPAAKRAPAHMRRGGRKELTTITADPLMADPALTAVAPLLTFDVTAPDGLYAGAFQGSTPEDAILSYVATLGYASIDDAAMAMGFADAATYLSAFSVTETLSPAGMDPALGPVDPLAAPAALSRRGRRPCFVKMGASVPIVGSMPAVDPSIVSGVVVAEATLRRYRAVVSRTANATAVVEFDAYEDEDLYMLAEALVPQIPAEAWSVAVDPNSSWGYIDRIEPLAAAADPALTTLSRRGRKGIYGDVMYVLGSIIAGGAAGYVLGSAMGWIFSTIEDAYDALSEWWNEPSSVERASSLRDSLTKLRSAEAGMVEAMAVSTDSAEIEMISSTLNQLRDVIASVEADLANPETLSLHSARSQKMDVGSVLTSVATFAAGLVGVAAVAAVVQTLIEDAIDYFNSWLTSDGTDQQAMTEAIAKLDAAIAQAQSDLSLLASDDPSRPEVEQLLADLQATRAGMDAAFYSFGARSKMSNRKRKAAARRLALKATFIVADATTGDVLGTYDATTSDDAILSYCAEAGYESVEAAAAGMGFATVDEFLASISVAEGAEAEPAPAETPAETLSRRHRLMRKAAFDIADPVTGEILGTYDAGTIDDAILSYAASLGFASADEAAAAAGLTVEEWLATFTITEAVPAVDAPPAVLEGEMDEEGEDEEEEAPAEVSRRRR